jgi:hypothetical protein
LDIEASLPPCTGLAIRPSAQFSQRKRAELVGRLGRFVSSIDPRRPQRRGGPNGPVPCRDGGLGKSGGGIRPPREQAARQHDLVVPAPRGRQPGTRPRPANGGHVPCPCPEAPSPSRAALPRVSPSPHDGHPRIVNGYPPPIRSKRVAGIPVGPSRYARNACHRPPSGFVLGMRARPAGAERRKRRSARGEKGGRERGQSPSLLSLFLSPLLSPALCLCGSPLLLLSRC